jgi:uncharacterized lipoprotein YajG
MRILFLIIAALLLQGCVAQAAVAVVKAPFQIAGAALDAVTTSQDEADLKRGREARKQDERDAKQRKKDLKRSRSAALNQE